MISLRNYDNELPAAGCSSFAIGSTNRNSAYLCKEIHYNTLAREWRCIWSEEDQKRSLTELQRVLEDSGG